MSEFLETAIEGPVLGWRPSVAVGNDGGPVALALTLRAPGGPHEIRVTPAAVVWVNQDRAVCPSITPLPELVAFLRETGHGVRARATGRPAMVRELRLTTCPGEQKPEEYRNEKPAIISHDPARSLTVLTAEQTARLAKGDSVPVSIGPLSIDEAKAITGKAVGTARLHADGTGTLYLDTRPGGPAAEYLQPVGNDWDSVMKPIDCLDLFPIKPADPNAPQGIFTAPAHVTGVGSSPLAAGLAALAVRDEIDKAQAEAFRNAPVPGARRRADTLKVIEEAEHLSADLRAESAPRPAVDGKGRLTHVYDWDGSVKPVGEVTYLDKHLAPRATGRLSLEQATDLRDRSVRDAAGGLLGPVVKLGPPRDMDYLPAYPARRRAEVLTPKERLVMDLNCKVVAVTPGSSPDVVAVELQADFDSGLSTVKQRLFLTLRRPTGAPGGFWPPRVGDVIPVRVEAEALKRE